VTGGERVRAVRLAVALLLAYAAWSAAGVVAEVRAGASGLALSQALVRLAGVGLLAWGLWQQRAWAWWFVVGSGALAALSGAALLAWPQYAGGVPATRLVPLAVLPALTVACLFLPSARRACGAFRPRA
jgi:hypothetical protein